jgi:hypothetical protein
MYYRYHNPPHFHAEYGSDSAIYDINTLAKIEGRIPARAAGLIVEWALLHNDELFDRWAKAREYQPLERIDPLP